MSAFGSLLEHWIKPGSDCRVWGLDVGGANLKVVAVDGATGMIESRQLRFPLWKSPAALAVTLEKMLRGLPTPNLAAVTMTGEIADCFPCKSDGVAWIISHCQQAMEPRNIPVRFYDQQRSGFVDSATGKQDWTGLAASNWHAVARVWGDYLTARFHGAGLVLDLGSTTFDLTYDPVWNPAAVLPAKTDWERMLSGDLIYTGVRRSPLSCILPTVDYQGQSIGLAHELFATIEDAYVLTGDLPERREDSENGAFETADARPADKEHATQRISRMFCSDSSEVPEDLISAVAKQAKTRHLELLSSAILRKYSSSKSLSWCLLMGEGEGILQQAISRLPAFATGSIKIISASHEVGITESQVMPALCVAVLAVAMSERVRATNAPGQFIWPEREFDC